MIKCVTLSRKDRIISKLRSMLTPDMCEVIDESHLHAGHAGASPLGETHYKVTISSPLFVGKNLIDCHRMINNLLKEEFEKGLHALQIEIKK